MGLTGLKSKCWAACIPFWRFQGRISFDFSSFLKALLPSLKSATPFVPFSTARKAFLPFKGSSDWIGPTCITHANLPHVRVLNFNHIHLQKCHAKCNIHRFRDSNVNIFRTHYSAFHRSAAK